MVLCLVDRHNNFHLLHWFSAKFRQTTRSMLAGETYAFFDGYDYGMTFKLLFLLTPKVYSIL